MPEIEIKRVRFFDGQFLKQLEFRDEQAYHQHKHRRQLYALYSQDGVIPVDSPDDLRFFDLDNVGKTFRVRSGMAITRRADTREGKEIVLREDSVPTDLAPTVTAGGTAFVTLHYHEEEVTDPASEGDEQQHTRVREQAEITVFSSPPPSVDASSLEPYILLGTIDFDTMTAVYTSRQEARIRASLLGGGIATPAPTLSGLNPSAGSPGDSISGATMTGTNLSGVTTGDVTEATGDITNINVNSVNAAGTEVNLDFDIAAGASSGTKTLTVTTADGSATIGFAVSIGTPVVVSTMLPSSPDAGQTGVRVRGTNIRNPAIAPGAIATGTLVRFVDATDATRMTTAVIPIANVNAGANQEVQLTIPAAAEFTDFNGIAGVPAAASSRQVFVQVDFGGSTGTRASTNDIDF